MAAIDILIEQIVQSPGKSLVRPASTPPPMAWSPPGTDDRQWGWYDFPHGALAGLEVIEHQVSSALCQAVFQTPVWRPAR
jgi:hypothetical protein